MNKCALSHKNGNKLEANITRNLITSDLKRAIKL